MNTSRTVLSDGCSFNIFITDKFRYPAEDLYPLQTKVPLMRLHENLSLRVCLDSNPLSLVCSKSLYPEKAGERRALKSLREI
jgi:hypothetical protein